MLWQDMARHAVVTRGKGGAAAKLRATVFATKIRVCAGQWDDSVEARDRVRLTHKLRCIRYGFITHYAFPVYAPYGLRYLYRSIRVRCTRGYALPLPRVKPQCPRTAFTAGRGGRV